MDSNVVRVWALEFDKPGHKLMMLCLAKYSTQKGFAWPAVSLIARECCTTPRTVHNWINELIAAGYLVRRQMRRANGSNSSSRYFLKLPALTLGPIDPPERPDRDGAIQDIEGMEEYGANPENGDTDEPGDPPAIIDTRRVKKSTVSPDNIAGAEERKLTGKRERKDSLSDRERSDGPESLFDSDSEESVTGEEDAKAIAKKSAAARAELVEEILERMWSAASTASKRRSSKAEVRAALKAAMKAGTYSLDKIAFGHARYLQTDDAKRESGNMQPGLARWIRKGRYEPFIEEEEAGPEAGLTSRDLGTLESPSPIAQRLWMRRYNRDRSWKVEYGPMPGDPGCRVSPDIQREFGWDAASAEE